MQMPRKGTKKNSRQVKGALDRFLHQIVIGMHHLRGKLSSDEQIKWASDEQMIKRLSFNQVQVTGMRRMM
jgi:hypothetical protein